MLFKVEDKTGGMDDPTAIERCLSITYNGEQFYYTDNINLMIALISYGYHPVDMLLMFKLFIKKEGGK